MRSAFLCLALIIFSVPAWAGPCNLNAGAASVILQPSEQPIHTNFTLNHQQMNIQGAGALKNPMAGEMVGGLAHGIISSNVEISYLNSSITQNGQAWGCAVIDKVVAHLDYQPNIFISREYQPGTCYHQAVMAHEMKHVVTDRQILQQFAPRMRAAFAETVQKIGVQGPVPLTQLPQLDEQIKNTLQAAMSNVMNVLKAERDQRQAMVDTPSEYARVQALCRDWP